MQICIYIYTSMYEYVYVRVVQDADGKPLECKPHFRGPSHGWSTWHSGHLMTVAESFSAPQNEFAFNCQTEVAEFYGLGMFMV